MPMFVVPDSFGSPTELFEFNPCHSSADGTFTVKGQGRCLGTEARVKARQEYDAEYGANGAFSTASNRQFAAERKRAKAVAAIGGFPAYMAKDVATAKRTDGAIANVLPSQSGIEGIRGDANSSHRLVTLYPHNVDNRVKLLTVLRHELGHIDRTPLGKGGRMIGGLEVGPKFSEEIRAWKNAIRNSGGKISMSSMEKALASYMVREQPVRDSLSRAGIGTVSDLLWSSTGKRTQQITFTPRPGFTEDDVRDGAIGTARALTQKHIMPVMRRYRERIRRAVRVAK